jgi:Predicted heme/steroid binding protein
MIYFEYRTIDELIGDNSNFYRQQKQFTLFELSQYDGKNGKPAYVAIDGIVYDVSNESAFRNLKDIENIAGNDLTEQYNFFNRINEIINKASKIGELEKDNGFEGEIYRGGHKQYKHKKSECNLHQVIDLDVLAELEYAIKKFINQIIELEIEILKCSGTTTKAGGTTEEKVEKISSGSSAGKNGIVGGAGGSAGGGLGVEIKTIEKSSSSESKSGETQKMIPHGEAGGVQVVH